MLNTIYSNANKKAYFENKQKVIMTFWVVNLAYCGILELDKNNQIVKNLFSEQLPIMTADVLVSDNFIEPVLTAKMLYMGKTINFDIYRSLLLFYELCRATKTFNDKRFKEILNSFNYKPLLPTNFLNTYINQWINNKIKSSELLYHILIVNNQEGISKNVTVICDSLRNLIISCKV